MIPGRPGGRTYCRAPLSPPWGDPGAFLLGSRSPVSSRLCLRSGVPTSQGSPTREELRGPSSYLEALPASPAQGREHRLILCKTNIFSGAAPASHTILFSSPTNPLIEDKAPVNPCLIKAATKLAKMCPRLQRTKQTRGWGLRGEMSSLFSPGARRDAGGDRSSLTGTGAVS